MLPHTRAVDGVRSRLLRQRLDHKLRGQRTVTLVLPAAGETLFQIVEIVAPVAQRRRGKAAVLVHRQQPRQHLTSIAHNGDVHGTNLADLRRVNIGVNYLCIWGKRRDITGHAVVETRPDGDQQVTALHSGNSRDRAVHAGHAHVQLVGIRE